MKEMWKELGNLLNTKKKIKGNSISKLSINNQEIPKDKDIANALNNHFTKISKNLADKVRPERNDLFKNYLTNPISESLFLQPTNNSEVLKQINQLKNKATIDIRVSLLKYMKQQIVNDLVIIILNKSFEEGCFPELLKIAKVIPMYKSKDPTDPSNYRPISLLSVFDKLLERLMYNRLALFFQKHKVFYKYPFGFRRNHATNNALTKVMNYIYKSLDEGNYVFGIYIYIYRLKEGIQYSAAPNTPVQTSRLWNTQLAFQWFESYLSKRKQFVVVNNMQSDISELCEYGVPQGSVLGPILFLLFINDIHRSLRKITMKLFADDTNYFISDKNFNPLERLVEIELNKLQKWINANKLTINFILRNQAIVFSNLEASAS